MGNHDKAIGRLREAIEAECGRKMRMPKDYDFLADAIFERLHQSISPTTLKRLWGYLSESATPRTSTLDILAQFVNYDSWQAFCQQTETSTEKSIKEENTATLSEQPTKNGNRDSMMPTITDFKGMKRKLLLTFAMLLGVAQMSWSDDVFYIEDYDSSAKTATLKWGEAPATAGGYLTKSQVNVTGASNDGSYWATYYKSNVNRKAVGATVYAATRDGMTLNLVEVEDKIIKAGEGVILKRDDSSVFSLTSTTDAATDSYYADNVLGGSDVAAAQESGNSYYVLSIVDSKLGFYKYKADKTLGANKAYIALASSLPSREYFLFNGFDNPTAIAQPSAEQDVPSSEVFDLQGRRIARPSKGLYVVRSLQGKNGKKVIVK